PGELTRRYIEGQRASFISPIALFLFTVFLTFAVMSLTGNMFGSAPANAAADVAEELRTDQQRIAQLEQQRAAAAKSGASTAKIDEQLVDLQAEVAALQIAKGQKVN